LLLFKEAHFVTYSVSISIRDDVDLPAGLVVGLKKSLEREAIPSLFFPADSLVRAYYARITAAFCSKRLYAWQGLFVR